MNQKHKNSSNYVWTKKLILPLCLLIIVLLSAKLDAQEKTALRLTPDQAVDLALKSNLGLESSKTGLETKRRASALSWNQFLPSITIGAGLSLDNKKGSSSGLYPIDLADALNPVYGALNQINQFMNPGTPAIPLLPPDTIFGVTPYTVDLPRWHIVGTINTSLTINAAMFENIRRLRLDYETGLISHDKAKLQLERDVRKAYHNMLLLQENIELMRISFANVERQVQMAQANYNAGLAPELVLLQARVARENMRPVMDQVENGLKLSMMQFAMFLGMDYHAQFELIPVTDKIDFIPLDVKEMISKAANGKPDILELRHTALMLQSARKTQINSLTPSLSLSWNIQSLFNPIMDPWKNNWFKKDNWVNSGSLTISIGVRLHSLIPWSSDFQGIKNLDDQIKTVNIGLGQMVIGTEIEVSSIVLSLERTRVNAEALAQTVSLAEQSYRLTEEAYRAGLQDYFQVQNAQQSLHQARVQLLEQQFNYLNGLIDLEYSIGVPFGTLSKRSR